MAKLGLLAAAAALIGFAQALWPASAMASLGARVDSVEADRAHFSAKMARAPAASAYSVNTLTLPNGGLTREYSRADGMVFAVAWQGPSRPDLRQLLGARFEAFQADNAVRDPTRRRRPLASNRADLIVHSAGRPGGFWGFAYIPQLVPAGFSASDMR